MLTASPEDISRAARRMLISYGSHAIDIARERALETGRPDDIRERDLAFMVLSEVEKMTRKGGLKPS
jgi:hypothetical protein